MKGFYHLESCMGFFSHQHFPQIHIAAKEDSENFQVFKVDLIKQEERRGKLTKLGEERHRCQGSVLSAGGLPVIGYLLGEEAAGGPQLSRQLLRTGKQWGPNRGDCILEKQEKVWLQCEVTAEC